MNPSSDTPQNDLTPILTEDSTKMKGLLEKMKGGRTEARLIDFESLLVSINEAWRDLVPVFKEYDVLWVARNAFLCLSLRNPDEFDGLCKVMSKEAICLGSVTLQGMKDYFKHPDRPLKIRVYATEDCWNKSEITDDLRRNIFGFLLELFQKMARQIEIDFGNYFCGMPPDKPTSFLVSRAKLCL